MQQQQRYNWRTFKFFEAETVKCSKPIEEMEITAATCGRNHIFVGDVVGMIKSIERSSMNIQQTFSAYTAVVTHLRMVRGQNVLISIGDENDRDIAVIKIWDFDSTKGKGNDILPVQTLKPFTTSNPPPIPAQLRFNYNSDVKLTLRGGTDTNIGTSDALTSPVKCFDVTDDLQHIALALTDNRIMIARGDLASPRAAPKFQYLQSKFTSEKLNFVGFPKLPEAPTPSSAFNALLFAVFEDATTAFPIPARNKDLSRGNVDERVFDRPTRTYGAPPECAALTEDGELVLLADDNKIVSYGGKQWLTEKMRSWGDVFECPERLDIPTIEGEKLKLAVHKHYLAVLTRDSKGKRERFNFGIFDREPRIKAVVTQSGMMTNVSWVLPDISDVMVICQDKSDFAKNRITKFIEVSTEAKFEQLFKKDMYDEAQKIAVHLSANAPGAQSGDGVAPTDSYDIAKRYGDHLYDKGKYEEAVKQYINAIGTTEPSSIIRKFLGEQRITNLTTYLEALHSVKYKQLVNKNHTTLLLNCYAKLKSEEKLNDFIDRSDVTFDAVNAIHVCRQAGYYDAALKLAKKYDKPDEHVAILLENQEQYSQALAYIETLELADADRAMQAHAKTLLTHVTPITRVTDVLIALCTNWEPRRKADTRKGPQAAVANAAAAAAAASSSNKRPTSCRPEGFMPAFVDTPQALLHFLACIVAKREDFKRKTSTLVSPTAFNSATSEVLVTLLELYLTPSLPERVRHKTSGGHVISAASGEEAADAGQPQQQLSAGASSAGGELSVAPQDRLQKADELLKNYLGLYDPYHALMLVQQHNHEDGVIFLLNQLGLKSEVFVYYSKQMELGTTPQQRTKAKSELLRTCTEAVQSPNDGTRDMWVSYLSLLVRSKDDVEDDITHALSVIESHNLLPPVAVIEILSASETLQLKAVRNYVITMIQRDRVAIEECQREIEVMNDAAKQLQATVHGLQTSAQIFQTAKCQQCDDSLELHAVVHFLCGHSFHEKCVTERDCNICGAEQRQHLQRQRDFDAAAQKHEIFFDQLRDAPDGFSVIADHFGRGIFSSKRAKAAGDADDFDVDDMDDDLYDAAPEVTNALESW